MHDNQVDSASSTCGTPHTARKQCKATCHIEQFTLCMNSWWSRTVIKCTRTCRGNCYFWMPEAVTFRVISKNYIPSPSEYVWIQDTELWHVHQWNNTLKIGCRHPISWYQPKCVRKFEASSRWLKLKTNWFTPRAGHCVELRALFL